MIAVLFAACFVLHVAGQCTGDLNLDGTINLLDVTYVLDRFGTCPISNNCPGDFTNDGRRDRSDVAFLTTASRWGLCFVGGTTRPR